MGSKTKNPVRTKVQNLHRAMMKAKDKSISANWRLEHYGQQVIHKDRTYFIGADGAYRLQTEKYDIIRNSKDYPTKVVAKIDPVIVS